MVCGLLPEGSKISKMTYLYINEWISLSQCPSLLSIHIKPYSFLIYYSNKMLRSVTTHQFLKTAASPLVMSRTVLPAAAISIARRSISTSMVQRQSTRNEKMSDVIGSMPKDVFREVIESRPIPMREEFLEGQKLTTESLEKIDFGQGKHFKPRTMGDKAAYYLVKALRTLPDTYFGNNHYMRSVMLET